MATKMYEEDLDRLIGTFQTLEAQIRAVATAESVPHLFEAANESNATSPDEFWNHFFNLTQKLSQECTKLALALSQDTKPLPETATKLCDAVECPVVSLVSLYFHAFPTATTVFGQLCWSEIRDSHLDILQCLISFVASLKSGSDTSKLQLQSTGTVWAACDKVAVLPRDNRQAFLQKIAEIMMLVSDASSELQECSNSSAEDDGDLNEQEKAVLNPSIALCKATKAMLSKLKSVFESRNATGTLSREAVGELDSLGGRGLEGVSPAVDDLATAFYSYQEEPSVAALGVLARDAMKLRDLNLKILEALRSSASWFVEAQDQERVEFLKKAVDHNLKKFLEAIENIENSM